MRHRTIATLLAFGSFLGGLVLTGCDLEKTVQRITQNPGQVRQTRSVAPRRSARENTITIASFNIQVFGTSKAEKPEVMEILAQVARQFDVLAIQELRTKDTTVLVDFLKLINAEGAQYDYVVGPRQGRTSSKEQYVFVFDTARIALDPQPLYLVDDPQDLVHREPLVASFRVRGPARGEAFTFTLMNVHTDPDETDTELDALAGMFAQVQSRGQDDVILLGDLNVDYQHLGRLGDMPNIVWTVAGEPTNTRRTKSYDNILFDRVATSEHTGYSGVLDIAEMFCLTEEQALDVSDHLPVWAEFDVREKPGPLVAARPSAESR